MKSKGDMMGYLGPGKFRERSCIEYQQERSALLWSGWYLSPHA